MQIKFNGIEIDLPGDHPIEIIVHKKDNIAFTTTNDKDFYGIRIKKGDREAPDKETNIMENILNAASIPLSLVPFRLGNYDQKTIDKKGFWEERGTRKDIKDERRGQRTEGTRRERPTKGRGR